MISDRQAITLSELNRRVSQAINLTPGLANVWITAETSDLRSSGGHCYMELIDKDPATGAPRARCRAVIWASTFARIGAAFYVATGSRLRSDMKIMAQVSVNYHSVYGFSLIINDVDPDYTIGDLARKRNEIIRRLETEGLADFNKSLPWSDTPYRVAIVSARGAAGYGDFVKQLHHNPFRLRFETTLFEATMQGERTSASVIAALEEINAKINSFDCVVIIRGGGAVSDLASFDEYDLALNVAQFPLPVIVGIGHQRDITVLDFVANISVKTPTAAAEALIGRMSDAMNAILNLGREILTSVTDRISGERRQLAFYQGNLPAVARNVLERNKQRVGRATVEALKASVTVSLARRADRLKALSELIDALSPEATMRRGYSITRYNGRAITDSTNLPDGAEICTILAKGDAIKSTVKR